MHRSTTTWAAALNPHFLVPNLSNLQPLLNFHVQTIHYCCLLFIHGLRRHAGVVFFFLTKGGIWARFYFLFLACRVCLLGTTATAATATATACCTHDDKDRYYVEKEKGGISCSTPPPSLCYLQFCPFVGTGSRGFGH